MDKVKNFYYFNAALFFCVGLLLSWKDLKCHELFRQKGRYFLDKYEPLEKDLKKSKENDEIYKKIDELGLGGEAFGQTIVDMYEEEKRRRKI